MLDAELGPLNQRQLEHNPGPLNSLTYSLSGIIFGHHSLHLEFLIPLFIFILFFQILFFNIQLHVSSFSSRLFYYSGAVTLTTFSHLAFIYTALFC